MPSVDTDSALAIEAEEFVWRQAGLTPAHRYLLPAILQVLRRAQARTVLDLGCGNGALTQALARAGFDMTGVDMSASGLALARRECPGIRFVQANLEDPLEPELRRGFDAVLAVEVIEHLLLPRAIFQRAREALRPGGVLVVTTPYHGYIKNLLLALTNRFDAHWHPLRDYGHVKFFSRATLTRLFEEQGFAVKQVQRLGRIPPLAKSMLVQGVLAA
jgi:2-polyprenyl-3-methyl-5-hydroxy-6-metoxy-1,4-benzoquinol methylase